MDISVSRLNGRLAAKLPPELPLGLVFVVGQATRVGGQQFVLREGIHQLNCRAADDVVLQEGAEVRASGHLMFDPEQLQYYLLARDIEIVSAEPLGSPVGDARQLLAEGQELLSALAAVKARAAVAPKETAVEMPVWVQKLAPPEVQPAPAEEAEAEEEMVAAAPVAKAVELDEKLISMLSAAMDSDDDLELTPELLAPYKVTVAEPPTIVETVETEEIADKLMDTAVPSEPTSYRPVNREDTDWLVILLIISFFVLTVAAFVTIVLLILQ
ncbi:MAG: hypothetical protein H6652_17260 [Ardenticatenaceae bacterium]|nr:hypothetical protein [Ardenticatenaceae bacterium]MCB8949706.1 hypothetical protein [Ardenticatenaceae bacterium]